MDTNPRCPKCNSEFISIMPAGQISRWWILGSYLLCGTCQHEFQIDESAAQDTKPEARRSTPKHQRRSPSGGQYIAADDKPWNRKTEDTSK